MLTLYRNWPLIIISGVHPIAVYTPRGVPYQRTTLLYSLLARRCANSLRWQHNS